MFRLLHSVLILFSILGTGILFAQETEAQLKSKADQFFQKQDFVSATPAYLQLLALQPRSPEYNYKYGTCLLYNSRKKQDAIKYLEFATANPSIEPEAFYYMGKAYHLTYQFDEAILFYNLYKTTVSGKTRADLEVDLQIAMCGNGKRLLKNITDIIVLEKKEYASSTFYKLYDLTDFGGDILVSYGEQSKIDKKKNHVPIIHFPPNAQAVFFSSYGDNESNGKQIYVKKRLKEGGWSTPELVRGNVNTKFDEDFPYMHPNGEYLYFSSKGHNSMGGYDVFKAKYNAATNSFETPENVDFAISSADDDLFYMVDSLEQNAWFASARQSVDGKIHVYKVKVERVPSAVAAIKGTFNSTISPENKKFNIEVKDVISGRTIGTFYSDKQGGYLIALPKGGTYEYAIHVMGTPETFKATVKVPETNQMKVFKQFISHEMLAGKEAVKVVDLFDQTVENADAIVAEIIKSRSELNPNVSQFDLAILDAKAGSTEVFANLGMRDLSPLLAKDHVLSLVENQQRQATILKENQAKALGKVAANAAEIKQLQVAFKNKVVETNKAETDPEKLKIYREAQEIGQQIAVLQAESKIYLVVADSLNGPISLEEKQASSAKLIADFVQEASKSGDASLVQAIVSKETEIKQLQALNGETPAESLAKSVSKLTSEMDKLVSTRKNYVQATEKLTAEIKELEGKLSTSKTKEQPSIQSQIDAKKGELDLTQQEVNRLDKQIAKLAEEKSKEEAKLNTFQVIQQLKNPTENVSYVEAQKRLQGTEDQNFNTLKAYVAQQQELLEKGNELATENPKDNSNPTLNASSNANANSNFSNEVTSEVKNPENSDAISEEVTTKLLQEVMQPALYQRLDEIANNPDLDPLDQLKMAQIEELEFEKVVNQHIASLKTQLKAKPNDAQLKSELKSAQAIEAQIAENIDNRSLAIASLDPTLETENEIETSSGNGKETEVLVENTPKSVEEPEVKISENTSNSNVESTQNLSVESVENLENKNIQPEVEIQPLPEQLAYTSKIKAIEDNDLLSPIEKEKKRIQEEEKLQNSLTTALEKNQKELVKSPNDLVLKTKSERLNFEIEQSQNRVAESKQVLISEEKASIKPAEIRASIDKSYLLDVQKIENSDAPDETAQLIAREQKSQALLTAQLEKNKQQLAKKENTKLLAKIQVLNELIDASQSRIDALSQVENTSPETVFSLENFRKEQLGASYNLLTVEPKTVAENQQQVSALEVYQQQVRSQIQTTQNQLQQNPTNTQLSGQLQALKKEDESVSAKRSALQAQQKTLANQPVNPTVNTASNAANESVVTEKSSNEIGSNPVIERVDPTREIQFENDPTLQALRSQSRALEAKKAEPNLPAKEAQKLEKELERVQQKEQKVVNQLLENEVREEVQRTNSEVASKRSETSDPLVQVALNEIAQTNSWIEVQQKSIQKDKNEANRAEALKQISMQQAEQQQELKAIEQKIQVVKTLRSIPAGANLTPLEVAASNDLVQRRRRAMIEIGELTSELERIAEEIAVSPKSELQPLRSLEEAKTKKRSLLEAEVREIESVLEMRNKELAPTYNPLALQESISYEEELRLASSPEYKGYYEAVTKNQALKSSISKKKARLENLQRIHSENLAVQSDVLDPKREEAFTSNLKEIANLIAEIETDQRTYELQKEAISKQFPNLSNVMKIQNLVAREIAPIVKAAVLSSLVAVPASGFEIAENPATAPVKKMIPVGVESPAGLVYRVQVGAFAKPLKEQLFKEFNPVSGEKMENGITRYMAGYFNNRNAVLDARKQIIELGYSDAFPVAYCDGKRISMLEARRLEESGLCVAKGVDSLMIAVVENMAEVLPEAMISEMEPGDTTKNIKTSPSVSAYNKAPGAVKATAVETKKGLFFTVQIGVFNKPVSKDQIKEIEPLITKRLENGQIRYSAGVFHSVEESFPKKQEAIVKGIKDAFITAYYQGERISLDEARKLLAEKGKSILEPVNAAENKVVSPQKLTEIATANAKLNQQTTDLTELETGFIERQMQFVSKKSYATYPYDMIRRFNENGLFYFDETDQRVKSIVYKNEDYVPQIYNFREVLDTVFIAKSDSLHLEGTFQVAAKFPATVLPGEVGNWLVKTGYLFELKHAEDKIQLRFFRIPTQDKSEALIEHLKSFGFAILMHGD